MKLKLYKSIFHVFSFLSDKTNGANLFVKYKLLLGTLIIGLAGTPAKAQKKETTNDTIPLRKPLHSEMAFCYKVTADSTKISQVSDTLKEVIVIGRKSIAKDRSSITCYAVQVIEESAIKTKAPINIDSIIKKPLNINISNELTGIMCYGIVNMPYNNDDIYASKPKERDFYYDQVTTKPISPAGNLEGFVKWIQNTKQMCKDAIEGEVILSFVINKRGKLENKKIIKSLSKEADKEVLKIVSKSEKWKPGELYGNPVKTRITITVKISSDIK